VKATAENKREKAKQKNDRHRRGRWRISQATQNIVARAAYGAARMRAYRLNAHNAAHLLITPYFANAAPRAAARRRYSNNAAAAAWRSRGTALRCASRHTRRAWRARHGAAHIERGRTSRRMRGSSGSSINQIKGGIARRLNVGARDTAHGKHIMALSVASA